MKEYGDASQLEIKNVEKPTINKDQILVKVLGSSVNPVDWKVRQGDVKIISGHAPRRLGADYSGVVEDVGKNINTVKPGDEVYGMVKAFVGDAYADYVAVSPDQIALKPKNLNFVEAAALPLVALTIYQLYFEVARVTPGARVLINGCAGGIGHIAVQMAKALDCHVTGVCSTKNVEYSRSIGVDHVIDYTKEDIFDNDLCFDLFFDAVANASFRSAKQKLTSTGQYVSSIPSFQNIVIAPITNLFSAKKHKKVWVLPSAESLTKICEMVEVGKIKPTIQKTYPIEQIADAHRHSETGKVVGKIALSFA